MTLNKSIWQKVTLKKKKSRMSRRNIEQKYVTWSILNSQSSLFDHIKDSRSSCCEEFVTELCFKGYKFANSTASGWFQEQYISCIDLTIKRGWF